MNTRVKKKRQAREDLFAGAKKERRMCACHEVGDIVSSE